jgi:hypothetical protein
VADLVQVETALRLAGERQLLGGNQRGHWSSGLSEIAAALVLLCDLPRERAESVVEDYGLAQSLRGQGPPPQFRARRRAARQRAAPPKALAAPTVVACNTTVDRPDGRAHIGSVVFTEDACHIAVRYDGAPSWSGRGGRYRPGRGTPPPGPPQLAVTDDQGTRADAHFGGGGGQEGWQGRWTTTQALSARTRWLDLSGHRVELGHGSTPTPARVEPLPDEPLAHRYLWHRLAAAEPGPPHDDNVVEVLIELGVVDRDDPIVDEVGQIASALQSGSYGGSAPRNAKRPWKGLLTRRHREDGPTGDVPLAAATPEFDDTVVVVYDMRSEPNGFSIQARVLGQGSGTVGPFHDDLPGIPLAWWAEDDRGNTYLGHWGGHGGNSGDISGDLNFYPPLDPKARQLRILPTGLTHRAVIEVTLPDWPATQ